MKPALRQVLLLFSALPLQLVTAAENPALILPPERGWLKPDETIRLQLPPRFAAARDRLQLELDAFDVTQQMVIGEGDLTFTPPEALDGGEHELSLLKLREDGELIELGRWIFEVRQSRRFQQAQFSPRAAVAWQGLVDSSQLDPAPERRVIQVDAGFEGAWANPGYRLQAKTQLVHDSSLDPERSQLYDFRFALERGSARLQLGQQAIDGDSLVLSDFDRRGLSGRLQTENTMISAFALRSDAVTALSEALVPRDRNEMTAGLMASLSPLRERPDRLRLRAIWIDSRGTEFGVADLGEQALGEESRDDPAHGSAWSLAIESRLLQQRLWLAAELARSRFDFDGSGGALDANSDEAYRLDLQYGPAETEDLEWTAGLRLQQVGTFFHSLANAALPNDKRQLTAWLNWAKSDLSGDLQLGVERDNVDDRAEFPIIGSRIARFSLTYGPLTPEGRESSPFANPEFQLSYARSRNRRIDDLPLYAGDDTDNLDQELILSASFTPAMWDWSVSYQLNRFEDDTGLTGSANSHLLGIEAGIPMGETLTISPRIQAGRSRDPVTGVKQKDRVAGMGLVYDRQAFSISLDYSLDRGRTSDQSADRCEQVLGLSLDWTLQAMQGRQPAVNLYLQANGSSIGGGADTRQILLGMRIGYGPE